MLMVVALIALSFVATAQQAPSAPDFVVVLIRQDSWSSNTATMVNNCMLVYPDGRFHREQTHVGAYARPDTRVFEGTIGDKELNALAAIISNPEFRSISGQPRGGVVNDLDLLGFVVITRRGTQSFTFLDSTSRSKYDKALKPLVEWFERQVKKKVAEAKGTVATGCQLPQQMRLAPATQE